MNSTSARSDGRPGVGVALVRALAAFCVTVSIVGCSTPAGRPDAAPTVREGSVEAGGGVRLFYRDVGDGPDPVVVLHGGPGLTLDYLADDLEALARHRRLIFYDQRGAGRSTLVSDAAALDAQRFADDLEAVRRHFGIDRLTLLGHSWGAGVAALYAMRHPDRVGRLLLVGPMPLRQDALIATFRQLRAGRAPDAQQRLLAARDVLLAAPGQADACRAFYREFFRPFFAVPQAQARSRGDFCAGTPESLLNRSAVERYTQPSLGAWDWRNTLQRIAAPTLVLHGAEDPIALEYAREWVAALPGARLLVYPGIGHFPYVEAPERFVEDVRTFLAGDWPAGAARAP